MTQTAIFIRPYARDILKALAKHFEIIIFTASHHGYANKVIDLLDPDGDLIAHRIFREHCFKTKQGVYLKDLRLLNRRLDKTIIVDNAPYSFVLQLHNGVPIIPFTNNKQDCELQQLTDFLLALRHEDDVRARIRSHFGYDGLSRARDLDECVSFFLNNSHP